MAGAKPKTYKEHKFDHLKELDGISDAQVEEHLALYAGYVKQVNALNEELTALRAQSHLPLPDLAQRALEMIGIVAELDASPSRAAPASRARARSGVRWWTRVTTFPRIRARASSPAPRTRSATGCSRRCGRRSPDTRLEGRMSATRRHFLEMAGAAALATAAAGTAISQTRTAGSPVVKPKMTRGAKMMPLNSG